MTKSNSCIKRPETFTYIQFFIIQHSAFDSESNIDEVSEFLKGSRYKSWVNIWGWAYIEPRSGERSLSVYNSQYIVLSSNGIASIYTEEEFNLIFEPK